MDMGLWTSRGNNRCERVTGKDGQLQERGFVEDWQLREWDQGKCEQGMVEDSRRSYVGKHEMDFEAI